MMLLVTNEKLKKDIKLHCIQTRDTLSVKEDSGPCVNLHSSTVHLCIEPSMKQMRKPCSLARVRAVATVSNTDQNTEHVRLDDNFKHH